jgi:hypothetical protein
MRRLHFLLLLLLLLLFLHATSSAAAPAAASGGVGCDRQCGNTTVPYPFGFSGACPIRLDCNVTTPQLVTNSSAASPYPILSFDATASTFLVSLPPSCNRTVGEARAALDGSRYGVTSHTGLFLARGCLGKAAATGNCSVSATIMKTALRTAGCGDKGAIWTCVAAPLPPPQGLNATAAAAAWDGEAGQFLPWKKVEDAGCEDALTSAVSALSPEGLPSVDFGAAELGWWLDGTCANATAGGQCARNATCQDIETSRGTRGHRCACVVAGMSGDGYAAGDGCYYVAGEFLTSYHCCYSSQ